MRRFSEPQLCCDFTTYTMRNADDEGVAHAEGPTVVVHTGIGPAPRETLKLFEFVRYEASITSIARLYDVLGARSPSSPLACEDGP